MLASTTSTSTRTTSSRTRTRSSFLTCYVSDDTEFEFIENIRVEVALPQQFLKQRMTLKNVQDCLLLSYILEGFLDEEEFCALYDVNSTDYPVFEHGKYRRFDLNLRS